MSPLPPNLESAKLRALEVTPIAWAEKQGWKLRRASSAEMVGACPQEGIGDDRFSINTRTGAWQCRKCGIGGHDVIHLVRWSEGVNFVDALERINGEKPGRDVTAEELDEQRRKADADQQKRDADAAAFREKAREAGFDIWERSRRPDWTERFSPVARYLEFRGIPVAKLFEVAPAGPVLHEIKLHPWREQVTSTEDGRKYWTTLRETGAMIACVQLPDNRFGAVHQTWIDTDQPKGRLVLPDDDKGKPRPTKKVLGAKKGGAIRLFTPKAPKRIVMGEGIETTLTAMAHAFEADTAYWAGVDLGNMSGRAYRGASDGKLVPELPDLDDRDCFLPPDWCEELVYLADGDDVDNKTIAKVERGLLRAQALRQLAIDGGAVLPALSIAYVPPLEPGKDLNDLVRMG